MRGDFKTNPTGQEFMSDIKDTPDQPEDAETNAEADAQAEAESANGEDTTVADAVEALVVENAELKDKLLRSAAEMENLRRRTEREIGDARSYAISSFARDMLTATDNLSRALMVVSEEARANADGTTKSLIEGIEMTEREMFRLLEKNGIQPIEAEGHKFDPHRHQAMLEIPNIEVPEGTVVQVLQAGFAIGERVLRPALVGVAKGGPKPAKPEAVSDDADAPEAGEGIDKQA